MVGGSLPEIIRQIVREEITTALANYPIIINVNEPLNRYEMDRLIVGLKRRLSHSVFLTSDLGEITRAEVNDD